jgi:hypothetical protein
MDATHRKPRPGKSTPTVTPDDLTIIRLREERDKLLEENEVFTLWFQACSEYIQDLQPILEVLVKMGQVYQEKRGEALKKLESVSGEGEPIFYSQMRLDEVLEAYGDF